MHSSDLIIYLPVVLSFVTTFSLCYLFVRKNWSFIPADIPNERSLHNRPITRAGGLAIGIGIYLAFVILFIAYEQWNEAFIYPIIAVLLVTMISLFDDYRNISFMVRILFHFIAAALIAFFFVPNVSISLGTEIQMSPFTLELLLMFIIVWFLNIFNFMDGSDGLAGTMALIGFATFALLGLPGGHVYFTCASLIIAAACTGFLYFNFPPARLFMGDSGSIQLGLLICIFSIWGVGTGIFPFYAPFILFSPFIYDTSITLVRRIWRREKVWQAHKTHYYQRLIDSGWSHRKLLLAETLLMLVCAMACVVLVKFPDFNLTVIFTGIIGLYLILTVLAHRHCARISAST